MVAEISPKSRRTVALLAAFLGVFGIHRLYLGKMPTAYVMLGLGAAGLSILGIIIGVRSFYLGEFGLLITALVLLSAVGVWALVDFILALLGKIRDSRSRMPWCHQSIRKTSLQGARIMTKLDDFDSGPE